MKCGCTQRHAGRRSGEGCDYCLLPPLPRLQSLSCQPLLPPALQVEDRPVVKERVEQVCIGLAGLAGRHQLKLAHARHGAGACMPPRAWVLRFASHARACPLPWQVVEHRPVEKEFVVGGGVGPVGPVGGRQLIKRPSACSSRLGLLPACSCLSQPTARSPTPSPRQVETRQTGAERELGSKEVEHLGTHVSLGAAAWKGRENRTGWGTACLPAAGTGEGTSNISHNPIVSSNRAGAHREHHPAVCALRVSGSGAGCLGWQPKARAHGWATSGKGNALFSAFASCMFEASCRAVCVNTR